jgi:esterase/lipase superfamily enzyme
MIEVLAPLIDAGRLLAVCVDGVDSETWFGHGVPPEARGPRYNEYQDYVAREVVPFARERATVPGLIAHGASFGAFHAANAYFKRPDLFDCAICLSGVYSLKFSVGDYLDDNVYYNDPLRYLANLEDRRFLHQLRQGRLVLCNGQGAWEEWSLAETRALSRVLVAKEIPHWFDLWGADVDHDWPWWKRQIVYFLGHLGV